MADILNIDKFIANGDMLPVTNPKMFDTDANGDPIPTKDGLFSFDIFGPLHTDKRATTWAYVNLGVEIVHPQALDIMDMVTGAFRKMLLRKMKYSVKEGLLVPDMDKGVWGVNGIREALANMDFSLISKAEEKEVYVKQLKLMEKNKSMFINKWIITPAGVRDYSFTDGRIKYDDVNDLYRTLISNTKEKMSNSSANYLLGNQSKDQAVSKETIVQKIVNDIHQYYIDRLAGKSGLIRGALIKKRTDFAARLVASALPEIPPLSATLPWGALLSMFAPFVIHKVENDESFKKILVGDEDYVGIDEYSNLFQYIFKNMSTISKEKPELKKKIIDALHDVIEENGLKVNLKRDPAFGDVNHWVVYPIIDTRDVYNIGLNSLYYSPIGGDSVNGRAVMYYNGKLRLNANILEFNNDRWGSFGSLDIHYSKHFRHGDN